MNDYQPIGATGEKQISQKQKNSAEGLTRTFAAIWTIVWGIFVFNAEYHEGESCDKIAINFSTFVFAFNAFQCVIPVGYNQETTLLLGFGKLAAYIGNIVIFTKYASFCGQLGSLMLGYLIVETVLLSLGCCIICLFACSIAAASEKTNV